MGETTKSLYVTFTGIHGVGKTRLARHLNSLGLGGLYAPAAQKFRGEHLVPARQLLGWQAHDRIESQIPTSLPKMMTYHETERAAGRGPQIIQRLNSLQNTVVLVDSLRHEDDLRTFRGLENAAGTLVVALIAPEAECKQRFLLDDNDDKHLFRPGPDREQEWELASAEHAGIYRAMQLADIEIDASGIGEPKLRQFLDNGRDVVGSFLAEQCRLLDKAQIDLVAG